MDDIRPTSAVSCPICNGTKKQKEYYDPEITGFSELLVACSGCNGKGWVVLNTPGPKNGIGRRTETHFRPSDEEEDDYDY